ncbi:MAG: carbamoyltransferase HypF [bacterium]
MPRQREKIQINGIVQGVGFRPFVYRLAQECRLGGYVRNDDNGVLIEAEGETAALEVFRQRLQSETPPLARIFSFTSEITKPTGEQIFTIITSSRDGTPATLISPDMSTCDDCLAELFDPTDRRFRYPFINCTNCGPRYTIVSKIPYDRPNTSMRVFELCPQCAREYNDPADRRFHAQPNACPVCGPQLSLFDNTGNLILTDDATGKAVKYLQRGKIVAIRGMGGFHLAVDAFNEEAVNELRRRKGRAEKPFALMAPDLATIAKFCDISPEEAKALQQQTRPIVLLHAKQNCPLSHSVAPGNKYLGFMLPYTPLHHLLIRGHFEALVMTSGNYSEEPIAIGNDEAIERLASLADYLLLHNREILQRCDDSIVRIVAGAERMLRRARGYAPTPVFLKKPLEKSALACGGELKNTIALSRGNEVFLSQHIGDLDNPSALAFFEHSIEYLQNILEIEPEMIAYDLHPEYLSTKWAMQQKLPKIGVQHHHAHLAAVLAENEIDAPTIGIILDGTGFGADGTIWGGEVLIGDFRDFERFAWLQPVAMPGGAAAIKQPWRMALGYLFAAFGENLWHLDLPFLGNLPRNQIELILQMIDKNLNSPLTSSCGRLFDAVSALLNIRHEVNYEAQAAIELEMQVDENVEEQYDTVLSSSTQMHGAMNMSGLIRAIVKDISAGKTIGVIASCFHRTLAGLFVTIAKSAREKTGVNRVGLSGGVYQNVYFFKHILALLKADGFEVLTHKIVPTNDGGLALGQAVIADAKMAAM